MILSSLTLAKETTYLGTFTIDNYPIKKCSITKVGNIISFSLSGYDGQGENFKKGFLKSLSDVNVRYDMEKIVKKEGYNAILGYSSQITGAFDTFGGGMKNGNLAYGVYRLTGQGTPVLIKCK